MYKSIVAGAAIALSSLSMSVAQADEVVDLFTTSQAELTSTGSVVGSSVVGSDIVGDERDISVSAGADIRATAIVDNGTFGIASSVRNAFGSDFDFSVNLQWDGTDNDHTSLDTTGLGGVDFSRLQGFMVDVLNSDGPGMFTVSIYDMMGEASQLMFNFAPVALGNPQSFFIPFAFFEAVNPSLDMAQVGALDLLIEAQGNLDVIIDSIQAVPEPSTLAVFGLALLGLASAGRRARR